VGQYGAVQNSLLHYLFLSSSKVERETPVYENSRYIDLVDAQLKDERKHSAIRVLVWTNIAIATTPHNF